MLFFFRKRHKVEPLTGSPYRTPAEMPVEPPPPKPKRQFKMPKASKAFKVFIQLIPVCACLIGIGLIYDAPILGQGLKWGSSAAQVVFGAFFAIRAYLTTQSNE